MRRRLRRAAVDRDAPAAFRRLGRAGQRHAEHAVPERGLDLVLLHRERQSQDALEAAAKELSEKIMPIGAKLYEAAAKEEAPADNAEVTADDKTDDAVEGEVVDDKDAEK